MKATKRIVTLLLSLVLLLGLVPAVYADADPSVTIQSEKNNAFDYLEYYTGSAWKDLNTPRHWIESTGAVCYCIEHTEGNPHGSAYTAAAPSSVFSSDTLAGLESILMFGYPCNTPEGFTEDEARQATANAIRFWLSENGEPGSYSFTNRKEHPTHIRAKKGYEHVLAWADELLGYAREHRVLSHGISFTPSALTLTKTGTYYSGSTSVKLHNINSGYLLDSSSVPSGVTIGGFTGAQDETLTISAPGTFSGRTFTITATALDTRSLENITAYIPSNNTLQKIFLCATTAQVVSTASIGVNTPAQGNLSITKLGENSSPLSGVRFGVYADADCQDLISEAVTGPDGIASLSDLSAGPYYIKELSTVEPYVLDGLVHPISVTADETAALTLTNETAKGQIRIEKTGPVLVGTTATQTAYGQLNTPVYETKGLSGCVFTVTDSAGNTAATLTTDENGIAETGLLPFGAYTVQETGTVTGYLLDATVHTVTLSYQDQNTPIVKETVRLTNDRIPTSLKIKKMTEYFDKTDLEFKPGPLAGALFGLFTAEAIGPIPQNGMVDLLTTNADGIAESTAKLPVGSYYLRELSVPDKTIHLLEQSLPVSISGNNTEYFDHPIFNERFKGNIGIWKEDEYEPGRMLAGARFEIRDGAGLLYDTVTTEADGYAQSIDLPVGTYFVQEIEAPKGFILSEEVFTVPITTDDKTVVSLERTNISTCVILRKTDLTTGKAVPDAMVKIYDSDGNTVFEDVTDQSGQIILYELPVGDYTYEETIAPEGYALNPSTFSFSIDSYGVVGGTVDFTDEPISLVIRKTDLYTGQPMENVAFRLFDADGQTVRTVAYTAPEPPSVTTKSAGGALRAASDPEPAFRVWAKDGEDTFLTGADGSVEFRYLPAGTYTLQEITPYGYAQIEDIPFTLTDQNSASDPLVISVENAPTALELSKVDASTNHPLAGAGFRIKVKGENGFETLSFRLEQDGSYYCDPNGSIQEVMTDGTGKLTFIGLPMGDIWIEESITPEGYFPISAQKVSITAASTSVNPLKLTISNYKFVKLGMDSDWWEFPALCLGIAAVLGGGIAVFIVIRRKKRAVNA